MFLTPNLAIDFKVIAMICNLHTISNNYDKYEHPWLKMKEEFVLQSKKLILRKFGI